MHQTKTLLECLWTCLCNTEMLPHLRWWWKGGKLMGSTSVSLASWTPAYVAHQERCRSVHWPFAASTHPGLSSDVQCMSRQPASCKTIMRSNLCGFTCTQRFTGCACLSLTSEQCAGFQRSRKQCRTWVHELMKKDSCIIICHSSLLVRKQYN